MDQNVCHRPGLARLARKVAAVVAECNYAQRRLMTLRLAPDTYMDNPDKPPATYAEFLFRAGGPLSHEPSAGERQEGHSMRLLHRAVSSS